MTNAQIKIHPLVGLKSFRIPEAGGAWRLFVLAKNISSELDHISRDELRKAARSSPIQYEDDRELAVRALDYALMQGFDLE